VLPRIPSKRVSAHLSQPVNASWLAQIADRASSRIPNSWPTNDLRQSASFGARSAIERMRNKSELNVARSDIIPPDLRRVPRTCPPRLPRLPACSGRKDDRRARRLPPNRSLAGSSRATRGGARR